MKKILSLAVLICFAFSSFAFTGVQSFKNEKHKTEKVLLEAVVASKVEVATSKFDKLSTTVFVQRQCSGYVKEASYAFANLQKQSFNYSRYWCRNYEHSNSIYNNPSIQKEYQEESDKEDIRV